MSNVLTDEEIQEMRNRAKLNDNRQIDPLPFARDVIAAVLAKAGEQEPLRYVLIGSNGEVVGKLFQAKLQAENYAESMLVGDFTATAIYAYPLPQQAIPELEIIGYTTRYFLDDCKAGNQSLSSMVLNIECPVDGIAIAAIKTT